MKSAILPRIQYPKPQTTTSQITQSLRLPREKHRFGPSSNPPRLPMFLQPSRLPRILRQVEIPAPKTPRDRQFLTILTSKSFSRAGVVQNLRGSTSNSAPSLPIFNDFDFQITFVRRRGAFNDFDFQIALARRCGANFAKPSFQKCSETHKFERFGLPNRSRAQA